MAARIDVSADDGEAIGRFADRVEVLAKLCAPGDVVHLHLSPEVALRFSKMMRDAERISRQGVVAVGFVEVDRPFGWNDRVLVFALLVGLWIELGGSFAALAAFFAGWL